MRGCRSTLGFRVVSLLWLSFTSAPLAAQLTARLDLSSSTRYVWHGLSRADGNVAQWSTAAGLWLGRLTIAGGFIRHFELDQASPGELSELGDGTGHVGEDDVWAEGAFEHGRLRFRSGVVRYVFRGESPKGGGGPLRNTTEIYVAAAATSPYLNPTVEVWWDVGPIQGGFLRASASSPVIGWPFQPFFFVALTGDVGVNVSQGRDAARPGDLANFAGRGVTHVGLGVIIDRRLHHWRGWGSASLDVGLNSQLNLDQATRYNGIERSCNLMLWLSVGLTLLLGGEAKTLR